MSHILKIYAAVSSYPGSEILVVKATYLPKSAST